MALLSSTEGTRVFLSTNFPSVKTLGYCQEEKVENITTAVEPPSSPKNLDRARLLQIVNVLR